MLLLSPLVLVLGIQLLGWRNVIALLAIKVIPVSSAPKDTTENLQYLGLLAHVFPVDAKGEAVVTQKLVTVIPVMRIRIMTVLTARMDSIMTPGTPRDACHVLVDLA